MELTARADHLYAEAPWPTTTCSTLAARHQESPGGATRTRITLIVYDRKLGASTASERTPFTDGNNAHKAAANPRLWREQTLDYR